MTQGSLDIPRPKFIRDRILNEILGGETSKQGVIGLGSRSQRLSGELVYPRHSK